MNWLKALCRRIGLRTFACDHSWSLTEEGFVSGDIARRMTGKVVEGEPPVFKSIDELYCFACKEVVATWRGNHVTTEP